MFSTQKNSIYRLARSQQNIMRAINALKDLIYKKRSFYKLEYKACAEKWVIREVNKIENK